MGVAVDRCSGLSAGLRAGASLAQRLQRVPQVQSALHGHAQSQGVAAHGAGEISAQLFTALLKVFKFFNMLYYFTYFQKLYFNYNLRLFSIHLLLLFHVYLLYEGLQTRTVGGP